MTRFSLQRHLPSLASYNHERFSFFDFLNYVLHTHFSVLFIHQSLSKHCLLHLDGRSTYARLYPLPDVLPCLLHLVCPVIFFFSSYYPVLLFSLQPRYIYLLCDLLFYPLVANKWNEGGDACLRISCESAHTTV